TRELMAASKDRCVDDLPHCTEPAARAHLLWAREGPRRSCRAGQDGKACAQGREREERVSPSRRQSEALDEPQPPRPRLAPQLHLLEWLWRGSHGCRRCEQDRAPAIGSSTWTEVWNAYLVLRGRGRAESVCAGHVRRRGEGA